MLFDHRLPAICTAVFSSVGVLLAAFSGASCNFLLRITDEDENFFDNELQGITSSFGVLCEHEIFPRDGDRMWELSRIFLIVGLSLGSLTAALAWAVATFLTPTNSNWNGISVLAAVTAVFQVPIFVLFEAQPCIGDMEDIDVLADSATGLGCKLGPSSYLLIASDVFFIAVTVLTQCFDRPRWGLEMELWKVHKKGQSRPRSKMSEKYRDGSPRNDEYYYDDNENYDDAMRLTSNQAGSLVSSEDDGFTDFYKISRVLPAGEAKNSDTQQKEGFFAKLFGSSSPTDDLEVPIGETQSMDEYDYESNLLHTLEIVRVLPQVDPALEENSSTPNADEEAVSANVPEKRGFQSFDAIVDDRPTLIPWMPSAATESNDIVSPLVEQHNMIDSPETSYLCAETNGPQQPVVSSVTDILHDLRCEEIAADNQMQQSAVFDMEMSPSFVPQALESVPAPAPAPAPATKATTPVSEHVAQGVRQLTMKGKGVATTIRNFGIFSKKGAYCQMPSDQSSGDFNSTTSEDVGSNANDDYFSYYKEQGETAAGMQMNYPAETQAAVNLSDLSDGIQEDEIKHIYDDLNQGNEETNSIVQKAQNTSMDSFAPFDSISVGSTHSDPGPISLGSGEVGPAIPPITPSGSGDDSDESFTDLVMKSHEIQWDNNLAADYFSSTDEEEFEEPSRGRSLGRDDDRRRRRPASPVGSIKSHGSLLHLTIDEETEEDVKNELDPNYTYPIKRTLSSPELRSGPRPFSGPRDKSTVELLKKLERLKHSINVDTIESESKGELPPLSPPKATKTNLPDNNANENTSAEKADTTEIISELTIEEAIIRETTTPTKATNVEGDPSLPTNLETNENESWKDHISPMKDSPSKERLETIHSPVAEMPPKESWTKPSTPGTMDISDESSETGNTRSTISYDSDDSFEGETGPRHVRSRSVGRMRKNRKHVYRVSSSLSPSRRKSFSEGRSLVTSNISSLARESRIRRLQQLRKGYVPLNNSYESPESPKPYQRDLNNLDDDLELTPKRKTAVPTDRDEIMSATSSAISNELFAPSLLEPDQPCPEFDNILDQLDLQLIDLNRPIGAEYGNEEGSM